MNGKQLGQTALSVVLLSLLIYGVSVSGTKLFYALFQSADQFSEETTIGPVRVAGLSKREAAQLVSEKTGEWQAAAPITLQYMEKNVPLDPGIVGFLVTQSVDEAADGQANPIQTAVSADELAVVMNDAMPALSLSDEQTEALRDAIAAAAATVSTEKTVIDIAPFVPEQSAADSVVAEASLPVMNSRLAAFIEANPSLAIPAGETVSLQNWLVATGDQTLDDESVAALSSVLYQLTLKTNFTVLERHISRVKPDAVPAGFEALVEKVGTADFVIQNENSQPFTVTWRNAGGTLAAAITGPRFYYEYAPVVRNKQDVEPRTIVQFSPDLSYGRARVERQGESGQSADVFRTVLENGRAVAEEKIASDFYAPVHRVEVHSAKSPPPESNSGSAGGTSGSAGDGSSGTANGTNGGTTNGTNNGQTGSSNGSADGTNGTNNGAGTSSNGSAAGDGTGSETPGTGHSSGGSGTGTGGETPDDTPSGQNGGGVVYEKDEGKQ